jgi:rhodanese-related sulfurtransferase
MMSRHKRLCLAGLLFAGFLYAADSGGASYFSPDTIDGARNIDAEGLIELADQNESPIIIDSRISSDRKLGYIPGSVSLPDTDTSCETLARTVPAKSTPVVFYCNGPRCRRSDNAVVIAASCGYSNIYWFRGGIEAWRKGSYPVEK